MQGYQVGVRFHPKDYEVVGHYLANKSRMGKTFNSKFIHDCDDFYGEKEPWVIWDMYGGSKFGEGEPLYFFIKRIKQNPNSKRFTRKVGSGTWSGEYSKQVLAKDSASGKPNKIGTMRNFRYENGRYSTQNGAWLMTEYEMAEEDALVLCALRKNSRKAPQPYPDQRDIKSTEKKSANDKKRKRHQPGKPNKKKKEEETYEVGQDLQPKKLKKEETYEEQGSSSCTQGLPYHHNQNNNDNYYYYYQEHNNDYQDHNSTNYYQGTYYLDSNSTYYQELVGNGDLDSMDDFLGPISNNPRNLESTQFQDQFYYGNNDFNWINHSAGGVSQQPNDQHTVDYLTKIEKCDSRKQFNRSC